VNGGTGVVGASFSRRVLVFRIAAGTTRSDFCDPVGLSDSTVHSHIYQRTVHFCTAHFWMNLLGWHWGWVKEVTASSKLRTDFPPEFEP
jgi:hypothetical protein